jgi:uncharacterized membrane protein
MPQLVAEWGELMLALICFLGAHSFPARPSIRAGIISRIGRVPYIVAYSLLSAALLMWIARASANAPFVELWPYDESLIVVPAVGMATACLLLVFGLTSPNPLSLSPSSGFDPNAPGVAAVVRHPVLWAALIWAGSHTVVNGDLAHLIVFGGFGVLAVVGMRALDRRFRKKLGAVEWETLARYTSNIPLLGLLRGARAGAGAGTVVRALSATLLYNALIASHEFIAGVPAPFSAAFRLPP